MKIIFFNIKDATVDPNGLNNFILENLENTDVFCFQEVFENAEKILNNTLKVFDKHNCFKYVSEHDIFSISTYVNPKYKVTIKGILDLPEEKIGLGLLTGISNTNTNLNIVNFHGVSRPGDKLDTPDRIMQSEMLLKSLKLSTQSYIIGGDFNLYPDTKSIRMFEDAGFQNLIRKYHIKNTRNEISWKKYPHSRQNYSDFVFCTPNLKIKVFSVPYNEYSDHLPLIVEF